MESDRTEHAIWSAYWNQRTVSHRNAVLLHYYPWIQSVVCKWLNNRQMPDLSSSMLSFVAERLLVSAIPRFDNTRGIKPRSFLLVHIFGAIHDGFRFDDDLARLARNNSNSVEIAKRDLADLLGHRPNDHEIADYLGWDESQVVAAQSRQVVSLPTEDEDEENTPTINATESPEGYREAFSELTRKLSIRQRHILRLRYIEGRSITDISLIYRRSRPWVSEILKRAKTSLRKSLTFVRKSSE